MRPLKIHIKKVAGKFGTVVTIDGRPVGGVSFVGFRHEAGELPIVKLELIGTEVEIEGEALVTVERPL